MQSMCSHAHTHWTLETLADVEILATPGGLFWQVAAKDWLIALSLAFVGHLVIALFQTHPWSQ